MNQGDISSGPISLKFVLERARGLEIRRMFASLSHPELLVAIRQLWSIDPPSKSIHFALAYADDEADRVVIATEADWAEAQRLHSLRSDPHRFPLRIFVKRKAAEKSVTPPFTPSILESSKGEEATGVVLDLLSRLFGCDAKELLSQPCPPDAFGGCVRAHADVTTQEMHVDINYDKAVSIAIPKACDLMDTDRVKCIELLMAALKVRPQHRMVRYNLACVHSLEGDAELALKFLVTAVQHGYKDLDAILGDEDLAHARADDRFATVLKMLAPEAPAGSVVTEKVDEKSETPIVPQEEAQRGFPNAATTELVKSEGKNNANAVIVLLSTLFECDAAKEMASTASQKDFGQCVTKQINSDTAEVTVDINTRLLMKKTMIRVDAAFEKKDYVEARKLLLAAVDLQIGDHAVLRYNLACANALLGGEKGKAEALDWLEEAVMDYGFDKAEVIRSDPDLLSIRDDPRYAKIMVTIKAPESGASTPSTEAASEVDAKVDNDTPKFDEKQNPDAAEPLTAPSNDALEVSDASSGGGWDRVTPPAESQEAPQPELQEVSAAEELEAAAAAALQRELERARRFVPPPEPVLQVMDVFPQLSIDEATNALAESGGDLRRTVEKLAGL